MKPVQGDGFEL